jgi:hypothetical protein
MSHNCICGKVFQKKLNEFGSLEEFYICDCSGQISILNGEVNYYLCLLKIPCIIGYQAIKLRIIQLRL